MDLASGYPFWPVKDGLIRAYPPLDRDVRCDVAVIGAGITGALVATALTDAGFDTVVLDRREVGWGSTASSTALLQYEIDVLLVDLTKRLGPARAARAYLACLGAIGKLERLARAVRTDVGFTRKKSLYLGTKRSDRKLFQNELRMRRDIGIRVDLLDARDVNDAYGIDRPAALLSRDAAQVDAYAFTHALLHRAAKRGLRVFDRTLVTKIDPSPHGVLLGTARNHFVRARWLVFASGYETKEWLRQPVAKLVSTFAVATEPFQRDIARRLADCVIWEHARPYLYLRTTDDNRVIIGGNDENFRNPDHRDRLLPDKARALVDRLNELIPGTDARIAFAWAGTFGETDDGLPYIGKHPDWPGCYFALGYGGNGITFSMIASEIIRDALCGRRHDVATLFSFDRAKI